VLYLIRHGQAEGNAHGRIMGQQDLPLTELGRRQAESLADWLAGRGKVFARVYASDLARAVATAVPIAAACGGQAVLPRPELRELGRGAVEGRTYSEASALRRLPGVVESFEREEAIAARLARMGAELRAAAHGADIAAVAHGGSIGRLLQFFLGLPLGRTDGPRFRLANTGVTVLDFAGGATAVLCVNALYHLAAGGGLV